MKRIPRQNPINVLYDELKHEDNRYGAGGKKIKKARTDVKPKRVPNNLKKAWEQHEEDFENCDEFFD